MLDFKRNWNTAVQKLISYTVFDFVEIIHFGPRHKYLNRLLFFFII